MRRDTVIDGTSLPQHITAPGPVAATEAVSDLPLLGYDSRSAAYITASLRGLSQRELRAIDAHESQHSDRPEIRERIAELVCDEPWIGYDAQSTEVIMQFLRKSGSSQAREVHAYERAHRDRGGIVSAADKRFITRPA
jgi:hypothetical protein